MAFTPLFEIFPIVHNNQFCETGSVYAQPTAVANNIER